MTSSDNADTAAVAAEPDATSAAKPGSTSAAEPGFNSAPEATETAVEIGAASIDRRPPSPGTASAAAAET
ncbi:MAG: hypothetical protein AAFX99_36665, partial [Myxococcota bacterium]